jgi:hypothetical protein
MLQDPGEDVFCVDADAFVGVSNSELEQQYMEMAAAFKATGLNKQAIQGIQEFFFEHGASRTPVPQPYSSLPTGGLPPNAVRLLVLPLATDDTMDRYGASFYQIVPCLLESTLP